MLRCVVHCYVVLTKPFDTICILVLCGTVMSDDYVIFCYVVQFSAHTYIHITPCDLSRANLVRVTCYLLRTTTEQPQQQ